jgi:hypothetical protein
MLGYRWREAITTSEPGCELRTIVDMNYYKRLKMVCVLAFSVAWMIPYILEDCVVVGEPTKGAIDNYTKTLVRP